MDAGLGLFGPILSVPVKVELSGKSSRLRDGGSGRV